MPSTTQVPVAPLLPTRQRRVWLTCSGLVALAASLSLYGLSVAGHPRYFSMIDTRVYLAGAKVLLHGGHLYALRTTGAHLQFTYPPAAAVLFAWMPVVGLYWTKVASTGFSVLALMSCVWLTLRWLQVPRAAALGLTGLGTAGLLWLEPVQATLHYGQINLLIMVLVLADLARRPRWLPPGVLIGIASGLKLVPVIFIVYLAVAGRTRAALTAIAAFAGTILLGFAVTPVQSTDYWTRFAFDTGRIGTAAHVSNQSMLGLMSRLAGGEPAARGAWFVVVAVIGTVGVCAAAALHRADRDVPAALTVGCTGLLISPISWNHHWVWAVPVAVALAVQVWRARSLPAGLALACWLAVFGSGGIWDVPRSFGREFRWSGWQIVVGNSYVLAGLAAVAVLALEAATVVRQPPVTLNSRRAVP